MKIKKVHHYFFGRGKADAFTTTEYIDGFQYKNESGLIGVSNGLQFFATSEGYFDFENNRYIYHYNDHLGNVRVSFAKENNTAVIVQQNDYYAFGLKHNTGIDAGGSYKYSYNGKEMQEEIGMYDYGARFYMPDLGRWGVIDPLAEMYRRHGPYNYAVNNPMRFIDPDGRSVETFTGEDAQNAYWHFYFGGSVNNFNGSHSFGSGNNQSSNLSQSFSYFDPGGAAGGGDCPSCSITEQNGREMVSTARLMGYNFAADNMEYFLNGKGGTQKEKIISSKFLKSNSSVRHGTALNIKNIFNKKINDKLNNMKLGETITISGTWTDSYYASANELDLLYGSGGYSITTNISLKVRRGNIPGLNGYTFSGSIGVTYKDTYDWDPGKGDYVPGFGYTDDSDFSDLKEHGQAADFDMKSNWNIKISDWVYTTGGVRASLINQIMQTR